MCAATVQQFLERYEVGQTIGVGGFSVVKAGTDKKTGACVAIKVVERSRYQHGDESLQRETDILKMVDHPHCIKLHAVCETEKRVFIVTELVSGGELLDRVATQGNYSEQDAAHLIHQVIDGVAYLHHKGIVHRDLKLENILLLNHDHDAPIKIADFGLSKNLAPNDVLSTMCGSPQYVAPEILEMGSGTAEQYSPACDMWSIGVILFILLSGYSPFDDDVDAVLFRKIKSGKYDADDPIWEGISGPAKDLVANLLVVEPSKRLTAEQALAHAWLRGQCGTGNLKEAQSHLKTYAERRQSALGEGSSVTRVPSSSTVHAG